MSINVRSIDHPVIAVADFERSAKTYERLGFTIPPKGSHLEWGTGNWCIMFPDDYLELRGIVDGSRYTHHLDRHLAEHGEGLMGLAFAPQSSAVDSEAAARASGFNPDGVKQLTRRFERPEGETRPSFSILYLKESEMPELHTTVVCQHLTPELIREESFLDHANGVTGIAALYILVADPLALRVNYARLLGEQNVQIVGNRLVGMFEHGAELIFLTPADAANAGIYTGDAPLPNMAAIALSASLERVSEALGAGGVPYERLTDERLRVAQEYACGVTLLFQAV